MSALTLHLQRITESQPFTQFIIAVIIFAGILVGLETYPSIVDEYGTILYTLDSIVLGIFIVEIVLKMGAQGRRPWRYFNDPWNVFDFTIVVLALIPAAGQYALVARLARLFRVLRLVRFIPRLRILVMALLKSVPSMVYVSMLLGLMFYMYAVAGTFLFAKNDPVHFGTLQESLLTLFRIVTLEDWTNVLYTQLYGCDVYPYGFKEELCTSPETFPLIAPLYFVSFVLMGTMIVLNLFIGVIISGMDEATAETQREELVATMKGPVSLQRELARLDESLTAVQDQLQRVQQWAKHLEETESDRSTEATDGVVDRADQNEG